MDVTFPHVFVLIVCKTLSGGVLDQNSDATHWQNRVWDMSEGKMHCRRIEVEVASNAEGQGQEAPPWTPDACQHTAMSLGPKWDMDNESSAYRFWMVACPTPIHASKDASSPIVGWKLPECPYRDGTVECEQDSVI